MKILKFVHQVVLVLFLIIFIGNFNKSFTQPIVGDWTIPTDFGEFIITVTCNGDCIKKIVFKYSNFSCGAVTRNGTVTLTRSQGGWEIINDQFTIQYTSNTNWGTEKMKISGTFNDIGDEASGSWVADNYGTICSGEWGPTTINAVAVNGRLVFPEDVSDKKYWVIIDDDPFNTDNSYFLKTEGICASGTTTDFSFDKITEGTYFLYAGVRFDSIYGPPPETIDYLGIYGGTFNNLPDAANVEISLLNQQLFEITMNQYTFVKLFKEHAIDTEFDGANFVSTADVDGDGELDILGSAENSNQIVWWENTNKFEFIKHIIDDQLEDAKCVYGGDLDNDLDMDIVAASESGNEIAWWENDGLLNFTKHIIVSDWTRVLSICVTDIDNDNDLDIAGASSGENEIAWWKNDGTGNFSKNTIDDYFRGASSIYVDDIDSDGDMDLLGAASTDSDIAWWENDGYSNFSKHTVDNDFSNACAVFTADINGDDKLDILGVARYDNEISWWENDGSLNFTKHIIDDDITWPESVSAADLDLDGDIDVLGAAYLDGLIIWYENKGGYFSEKNILNSQLYGACSVWPSDIDNDGDIDVIGASRMKDIVLVWENMNIVVGLENQYFDSKNIKYSLFQNYPNPFNPLTVVKYSIPKQSHVNLKVFDVLGSEVATLVKRELPQGSYEVEFKGNELSSGIYFYRIQAGDFVEVKKMVLMK